MTRFTFKTDNGIYIVANQDNDSVWISAIDTEGYAFTLIYNEGDTLSTFCFNHISGKQLILTGVELTAIWDRVSSAFNCEF